MFPFIRKFNKGGFTLLEVTGAIFIVNVGILAVFSMTIQTISLLGISSDRLIAAYLVQEGIETIRNIRDSNRIKDDNWDKDIVIGSDYELDFESSKFPDNSCNLAAENYLKYDSDDDSDDDSDERFYNCSKGTATKFKRWIKVEKPGYSTLNIAVKVEWTSKNRTYQITGEENLYDWQ